MLRNARARSGSSETLGRSPWARALFFLAGLWVSALPGTSSAQGNSGQVAAAVALFKEGRRLMDKKDYGAACPKFEESQRLDPALRTLANIAYCYEMNGRAAAAWATYTSVVSAAKKAGARDFETAARQKVTELEPTLPRLTITVSPEARVPGLEVRRDGDIVGLGAWGVAVPVDAGDHKVTAVAPGKRRWARTMTIADGPSKTSVEVPPLEDAPEADKPGTKAAPGTTFAVEGRGDTQRAIGLTVGGLGIAGIAVGTFYGLRSRSKKDESKDYCLPDDPDVCEPRGADLNDEAQRAADVATLGFIVGGVALATGVVLYLTAPSAGDAGAGATVVAAPAVGRNEAGLAVCGTW